MTTLIAQAEAICEICAAAPPVPSNRDAADDLADEAMCIVLREGQNTEVRRKLAAKFRAFRTAHILGALGAGT